MAGLGRAHASHPGTGTLTAPANVPGLIAAAYAALKVGGTLAVWSALDDRKFEQRLRFHGFNAQSDRVRARREKGGSKHTIFVGLKQAPRPAPARARR